MWKDQSAQCLHPRLLSYREFLSIYRTLIICKIDLTLTGFLLALCQLNRFPPEATYAFLTVDL